MSANLKLLIQAGNPLIAIETTDEDRAIAHVREVASELPRPIFEWSLTTGLQPADEANNKTVMVEAGNPLRAVSYILEQGKRGVYLFKDLGPHCKEARIHRTMRDLIARCAAQKSVLVLVDALPLPEEIKRFTVRYEIAWPSAEELEQVVRRTFRRVKQETAIEIASRITKREMEQLVQSLRGLSCTEAERVISAAIYDDYALTTEDLPHVIESKRTLLGSAGCLESIAADFSTDDIGGLDNLKRWLLRRRDGFSKRAREFGLEPPRGVLMLGVPGCGKSLCAKVVACDWKMPLLRLDPGVLYQKFIGESESQLRRALAQAEAMAPVVMWIDEIEKAFASASASSADGGLSKRMFGTLLSWMQDHRHPIFIIATANDVSALPPELMRKGRFDEIFFVDLPNAETRAKILGIHLNRRKRNPKKFDLRSLGQETDGFSGSELEQAVISAMFEAYTDQCELSDDHLRNAIRETRPLSVLAAEKVTDLRAWADGRCVPAD